MAVLIIAGAKPLTGSAFSGANTTSGDKTDGTAEDGGRGFLGSFIKNCIRSRGRHGAKAISGYEQSGLINQPPSSAAKLVTGTLRICIFEEDILAEKSSSDDSL